MEKEVGKLSEQQLQATCFQWHWNNFPKERGTLFHVQNNSSSRVLGNKRKAVGVVSGVSDLILILCGRVVFIEMKTETGTQSTSQKEFQSKVKELGHKYVVIRSFEEFKKLIYEEAVMGNN